MTTNYEAIIGLEIHVQLKTASKMFCACDNTGENKPINTTICPVCTGQPGTLPVANEQAIAYGVMASLALHCSIAPQSKFDRKSYFYPDLPKGYQISQLDQPVGARGYLDVLVGESVHRIGITRLHLEDDAAKLIHPAGKSYSVVDYNRAGTPLAEIVTEPDIRTPEEAKAFLQELRLMMRYLGVSDADMEKGHLRCDANISLRPRGEVTLWPKTEVKNINSFRSVERALHFEILRQTELWEAGTPESVQSTRGWDDAAGETVLQRTKEGAADYRYFPDPDLPPMEFTNEYLRGIQSKIPELPAERRIRFVNEYGLSEKDVEVLVVDKDLGDFAEEVMSELQAWVIADQKVWDAERKTLSKLTTNWLINRLPALLEAQHSSIATMKISAENFAEFVQLVNGGGLTNQTALQVLEEMFQSGGDPSDIVKAKGLTQINDAAELDAIVQDILNQHADVVEQIKTGKAQARQFLIGKVMAATKGRANPASVKEALARAIGEE